MAEVGAISNTSAVQAALLQAADTDTAKSATLLKKAVQADKDLVDTLLPADGHTLDVKA